jgi:hypothetical protein
MRVLQRNEPLERYHYFLALFSCFMQRVQQDYLLFFPQLYSHVSANSTYDDGDDVRVRVCVWGGGRGGGSAHEAVARVLTHDPDGLGLIRVVDDVLITASKAPSEMDRVVALAQK